MLRVLLLSMRKACLRGWKLLIRPKGDSRPAQGKMGVKMNQVSLASLLAVKRKVFNLSLNKIYNPMRLSRKESNSF